MLKIVEYNTITGKKVELEELEKYGFEYNKDIEGYERKIDNKWWNIMCIDKDRQIFEMTEEIGYWTTTFSDEEWFDENNVKDLQKDGLIEKVED